ncbi:sugar transferase [Aquincola sp. J276]|uniref:sugar transferase n=1 Tax=Aquincola sp. J276 TaxID=2898432 RepID=UPI002151D403|nr:sugar transferase [Aquincola sp. J276]MCR5868792.1 sugar transferase [Aquincola sp. J276]
MLQGRASSSATHALAQSSRISAWQNALHLRTNQLAALILLVLFAPLMGAVAFMIWRRDGAPIFFGHYRVGRDAKLFRCYKFRTMYRQSQQMLADILANDPVAKAEWERDQKLSNDPRITPIGHFLRRTSLDELPQLFNVLRGEMSLVGPRPITVGELTRYGRTRWDYLSVPPGMTGLWQVSGRNDVTYDERVALDRFYVDNRSIALDVKILLKTLKVVLVREGAR